MKDIKIKENFTPLEKTTDRERNSLTGFTLVEAVVATVIIVTILAGSGQGVNLYSNLVNSIHQQDVAIYAAQEKLEEIVDNVDDVASYNGQFFNITDDSGTNLLTSSSGNPPGYVSVAQNNIVSKLYNVNITITWQNSGRQQSLNVNTAFMKK